MTLATISPHCKKAGRLLIATPRSENLGADRAVSIVLWSNTYTSWAEAAKGKPKANRLKNQSFFIFSYCSSCLVGFREYSIETSGPGHLRPVAMRDLVTNKFFPKIFRDPDSLVRHTSSHRSVFQVPHESKEVCFLSPTK